MSRMKICYFGSYERDYSRNVINRVGLCANGAYVMECHVAKPNLRVESKFSVMMFMVALPFSIFLRNIMLFLKGVWYFTCYRYDILVVGCFGHLEIPIAKVIAKVTRRPLVFDPLVSLHDTFVTDRKIFRESSILARLLLLFERLLYRLPDLIILDTLAHADFFACNFAIPKEKMRVVYIGADDETYKAVKNKQPRNEALQVMYYGNYIPLHGVEFIIEAANICRENKNINFTLIGNGQTFKKIAARAQKLNLSNVCFLERMPKKKLAQFVQNADIILGAFQESSKTLRTVQNKTYEGLALGKAVITADTPAVRELFKNGKNIYLCKPASAKALSEAILDLYKNKELREHIAIEGHEFFKNFLTPQAVGLQMLQYCREVYGK